MDRHKGCSWEKGVGTETAPRGLALAFGGLANRKVYGRRGEPDESGERGGKEKAENAQWAG